MPPQLPAVVRSIEELSTLLQGREQRTHVLLDGLPLAGKTTTGLELSDTLRLPFHDLDGFLREKTGSYVPALDVPRIAQKLRNGPCVVAGVCMKAIHHALGSPPAVHVYIKRMAAAGWGWADEREASSEDALDVYWPPSALWLELRNYHVTSNPTASADIIFERLETARS